ncbi:ProQ/FINO family protein [Pectobacterium zantedeschiae]|uniref:ProQ/FINO family protein n=1 Tax=Pectobacterium zantedeschiae TaxID=2034769 RepID=UPI00101C420B|nr:hypothetical protein DEH81_02635 [Pectobacterium zantedeschiae]
MSQRHPHRRQKKQAISSTVRTGKSSNGWFRSGRTPSIWKIPARWLSGSIKRWRQILNVANYPARVRCAFHWGCISTRSAYIKALAAGGQRYDLNGKPQGDVTAEQQERAKAQRKQKTALRTEDAKCA